MVLDGSWRNTVLTRSRKIGFCTFIIKLSLAITHADHVIWDGQDRGRGGSLHVVGVVKIGIGSAQDRGRTGVGPVSTATTTHSN